MLQTIKLNNKEYIVKQVINEKNLDGIKTSIIQNKIGAEIVIKDTNNKIYLFCDEIEDAHIIDEITFEEIKKLKDNTESSNTNILPQPAVETEISKDDSNN